MDVNEKLINLYAIPPELIPDNALVSNTQARFENKMPFTINRSDNSGTKLSMIMNWFMENIDTVEDGNLICTMALPALSLNKDTWNAAIYALRQVLPLYNHVTGIVFVPSIGQTRDNLFRVSDWYMSMQLGSTMEKLVSFSNEMFEDDGEFDDEDDEETN